MKKINPNLTIILNQLADEAALPAEIDLWSQIRGRLAVSKTFSAKRKPSINAALTSKRRLHLAALPALFILIIFATLLFTPSGRAWAQQIWQFFTRASSDIIIPPWGTAGQQTTPPDYALPTQTPISLENCGSYAKPLCTKAQVQSRVAYTLKQFPALPEGVRFEGAYVEGDIVLLRYSQGLDLVQMLSATYQNIKPEVGASANIEEAWIGTLKAEYLQGSWYGGIYDPQITWQADNDLRNLNWQEGDIIYSIRTYHPRWKKEDLLELAESLIHQAGADPADAGVSTTINTAEVDPTHLESIAEAEALVGYSLKMLDPLPADYIFHYASVHQPTNSVCLHYMYTGNEGPGPYLLVAQGPTQNVPELTTADDGIIEPVQIGGADQGTAFHTLFVQRSGAWACNDTNEPAAALGLTWQAGGRQFDVYAMGGGCAFAEGFTTLSLLRLAEQLNAVSTHPADELDPECLANVTDAEKLAGFDVKEPAWIPEELVFGSVSVSHTTGVPTVNIIYKVAGDKHPAMTITQTSLDAQSGSDLVSQYRGIPDEGYEQLRINDQAVVIVRGAWLSGEKGEKVWYSEGVAETMYLEMDGLLITIGGPWFAPLPGEEGNGDSKEIMTAIAESLR